MVPLEQLAFNEKGISPSRGCVPASNLVPRQHALGRISPAFVGLDYQGQNIVFRFIIEYSSLRDFGPQVVGLFLYEDLLKMIFWLVLKLEGTKILQEVI